MADENNELRGFVRSEIKNIRDAAARNYEEHKTFFDAISRIEKTLGVFEERLGALVETKRAKLHFWATVFAAFIAAAAAIVANFR